MIDFTLKETSQDQLSYIGHGTGNMLMFTALAEGFANLD